MAVSSSISFSACHKVSLLLPRALLVRAFKNMTPWPTRIDRDLWNCESKWDHCHKLITSDIWNHSINVWHRLHVILWKLQTTCLFLWENSSGQFDSKHDQIPHVWLCLIHPEKLVPLLFLIHLLIVKHQTAPGDFRRCFQQRKAVLCLLY